MREEYHITHVLWDMYDSNNDGENIDMSINEIWGYVKGFETFPNYTPTHDYKNSRCGGSGDTGWTNSSIYDKRHIKYFKDFYDYLQSNSNLSSSQIDNVFDMHEIPGGYSQGLTTRP